MLGVIILRNNKNIIIILLVVIIAMLLGIIGLMATGFITFNVNDNVEKMGNNTDNDEIVTEDENSNDNNINDGNKEIYKQIMTISLSKLMDVYRERVQYFASSPIETNYGIVDINNDNIPELIIKRGSSEAEYECYFYTYDENEKFSDYEDHIVSVGSISCGHTSLYKMNDNTLLMLYAHMGYEETTYFKLENNWLIRTSYNSRVLSDDESYKSGDQSIKLVSSNDDSEFNKYK